MQKLLILLISLLAFSRTQTFTTYTTQAIASVKVTGSTVETGSLAVGMNLIFTIDFLLLLVILNRIFS